MKNKIETIDEIKFKKISSTEIDRIQTLCWSCPHDIPMGVIFYIEDINDLPRNRSGEAVPICDWCNNFYNAIIKHGFYDPIGEIFKQTITAFTKRASEKEDEENDEDSDEVFIALYQKTWSDQTIKNILNKKDIPATESLIGSCSKHFTAILVGQNINPQKLEFSETESLLGFAVDLAVFNSKPENRTDEALARFESELSKISIKKIFEEKIAALPPDRIGSAETCPNFIAEIYKAYSQCIRSCAV